MRNDPIFELDEYEQSIENEIENYVPVSKEEDRTSRLALQEYNKPRSVTITIPGSSWDRCGVAGKEAGMTAEEFAAKIIHDYTSGKMMSRDDVRKIWLEHHPRSVRKTG